MHGDPIRIYTIEVTEVEQLRSFDQEQISKSPAIYASMESKYFRYNGLLEKGNFFNFLNRILHPCVELDEEEKINAFLNATNQFQERTDFFRNGYVPLHAHSIFT